VTTLLCALCGCGPSLQVAQQLAERRQLQDDAPIKAEASATVAAPIETVWQLFSRVDRWPEWNPDALGASIEGPFAAGTAFGYGTGSRHVLTLAAVEPPTFVSFAGTLSGYVGITLWSFEALSPQQTRVTARESNDGFLISLFYSEAKLHEHLQAWVTALQGAAEHAKGP
jgi:hypothetical protein